LRPSFFTNEYLCALPFEARLLFEGLWTIADRRGRLEDRPLRIKGALFPYDNLDVNGLLQMLADSEDKFIIRYSIGGKKYIQITNFEKNQHIHRDETESIIPAPLEHHLEVTEAPLKSGATSVSPRLEHHSNTPSSLIACSPIACSSVAHSPEETQHDADDGDTGACVHKSSGIGAVIAHWQNMTGTTGDSVTTAEMLTFLQDLPPELLIRAIDLATGERKLKWSYVKGILQDWKRNGIRSVAEAENERAAFERSKEARGSGPGQGGGSFATLTGLLMEAERNDSS